MRRGFSFLEILIVTVILALGLLPIIHVFISTGRELKQSRPFMQSVFLAEKSLEHVRLAAQEDPYYQDRLIGERWGQDRALVAGGVHPVFDVIEDSAEPFGKLEPGKDLSIDRSTGVLFQLVEPISVALESHVDAADPGSPARSSMRFDWVDQKGKTIAYHASTPLRAWVPISGPEGAGPAPTGEELARAFGAPAGTTIDALAASRGATPKVLRALALASVLIAQTDAVAAKAKTDLDALQPGLASADPIVRAQALHRAGRIEEATAAAFLSALNDLADPVTTISSEMLDGTLGGAAPGADDRRRMCVALGGIATQFFAHMRAALTRAMACAREPALLAGQRIAAQRRVVRCARLEALVLPWPDPGKLARYLGELEASWTGRAPNFAHMFAREKVAVTSSDATYPLLPAVKKVRQFRENLTQASFRLALYGTGFNPGGNK